MRRLLNEDPTNSNNNLRARAKKIKGIFVEYESTIVELCSSNFEHDLVSKYIQMQDDFFELSTCCPSIVSVTQGSSGLSSEVQLPTIRILEFDGNLND